MPTSPWRFRLMTLMYVSTLLALWVQCLGWAAHRWTTRLRSKFSNRRSPTSAAVWEDEGAEGSSQSEGASCPPTEKNIWSVYQHLRPPRGLFSSVHSPSAPTDEAINIGLAAVSHFLPSRVAPTQKKAGSKPRDFVESACSGYCAMFPCGSSLTLTSALSGIAAKYEPQICGIRPILVGDNNQSWSFEHYSLDLEHVKRKLVPKGYALRMEQITNFPLLFNVNSLREVESKFHVLVPQDILMNSVAATDYTPHEGGAVINLFIFYRALTCHLHLLVDRLALASASSVLALVARLNLTLQFLQLFGRAAQAGINFENLQLGNMFVDQAGLVFIEPYVNPRKEPRRVVDVSDGSISTSGSHGTAPASYRDANTRILVQLLVNVWCVCHGRSFPDLAATRGDILIWLNQLDCSHIPTEVRDIISYILKENVSLDDILFTTAYFGVHARLRRAWEERDTGP